MALFVEGFDMFDRYFGIVYPAGLVGSSSTPIASLVYFLNLISVVAMNLGTTCPTISVCLIPASVIISLIPP